MPTVLLSNEVLSGGPCPPYGDRNGMIEIGQSQPTRQRSFQIKQKAVDVFLRPFRPIKAVKHPASGVFFGAITEIFDLGCVDGSAPIGVGDGFCLLNKT